MAKCGTIISGLRGSFYHEESSDVVKDVGESIQGSEYSFSWGSGFRA